MVDTETTFQMDKEEEFKERNRKRKEREERLRKLDYYEPTEDERREMLARNIALLDWSKGKKNGNESS